MSPRADDDAVFAYARTNRLLAADMFASLSPEQWRTPSLCTGWTVREVCAHLVPPSVGFSLRGLPGLLGLLGSVVRYRGDLDRMVDAGTRKDARRDVDVLVRELRERAATPVKAPVVGALGPMADTALHLLDAARPLELDVHPDPDCWEPVLGFLTSRAARGFLPPERITGLRLVTTDVDFAWGEGPELRGPAESVALAVSGRSIALPELAGPGVEVLHSRLEAPAKA